MQEVDNTPGEGRLQRFRSAVKWLSRFTNLLAILAVPAFVAVWLELASPDAVGKVLYWSVLGAVILIQIGLFVVTSKYAANVPELHVDLDHERLRTAFLTREIQDRDRIVSRLEASSELGVVWSALQGILFSFDMAKEGGLKEAVHVAVKPLIWSAGPLFDFEYNDVWTVTVYEYKSNEDILQPIWFERHDKHPKGDQPPRSWKPGDGHVGSAFMRERTLYTIDAATEDGAALVLPSKDNERDYDAALYRSFISAPIILDAEGANRRYGVLVLTSDHPARFNAANSWIVDHAASVLANLFDAHRLATQPPVA